VRVTVLYFAAVRELVGRAEESVELPAGVSTVAEFVAWLPSLHAELSGRMASVRIARNEAFALDGERVAAGDVLALIPPVAGG
jgi:molybdopterin converting factor subunit 1